VLKYLTVSAAVVRIKLRRVVSFTLDWRKSCRYPFYSRLGRHQSHFGCDSEVKDPDPAMNQTTSRLWVFTVSIVQRSLVLFYLW
jgi:hypothetical protein